MTEIKKETPKKTVAKPSKFKPPVAAPVTCPFGKKGTVWVAGYHTGVDYGAKRNTPVHAVYEGTIIAANWGPAYGIHVIIQHGAYRYLYGHLSSTAGLKAGTKVTQGQQIGLSGATGSSSAGPHLHLEARVSPYRYAVDAVDPTTVLK
jgi:murein DD-endopeptidase MepM/ murein hydrolase activator NlpD